MKVITTFFIVLLLGGMTVFARKRSEEETFKPSISPYLKMQFWNVASNGITNEDEVAADRLTSYFRRGRFGVKGKALPGCSYNLMLSFDHLGKDGFSSTKGVFNAGVISVWSAHFTYKINAENEWLNLTGGYFLPHLSREATTTPWAVSSLDKAENSCYLRQFVTGKANGISPGLNLGGLGSLGNSMLVYNFAIINRQDAESKMQKEWSPVIMGHFLLNIGAKEFAKYKYCFSNNILKKQKSATLGMGFSTQGKTDVFKSSRTLSGDFTIYFGCLKIDGEYNHLFRKNMEEYHANCYKVRTGYNIFLKKNWVLEPSMMYEKFEGHNNYEDASFFDGNDEKMDVGINLISSQKSAKLNLRYLHHTGKGTKNRYIKNKKYPGDYVVLGVQLII